MARSPVTEWGHDSSGLISTNSTRCCARSRPLIALPDNERSRPATNRTAPDDLLAGRISCDSRPDLAIVADDAWRTLTALLLTSPPVPFAQGLLDELPDPAPDAELAYWIAGIRASVAAGVIPNPVTAADAAIRAGIASPPGLRGLVVSSGYALVAEASSVPLACCSHFVAIVRAAHGRRATEVAAQRLIEAAWRGELAELAELWQREAGAALALLAEVVAE